MKYLRLIGGNQNPEFFEQSLPIFFLQNNKPLNVLIGANNSRKSRFLRFIIKQEFFSIYDANCALNSVYLNSLKLIEIIEKLDNNTPIIEIKFDTDQKNEYQDENYNRLKAYFDSKINPTGKVHWYDLMVNLKNINIELISAGVADSFNSLKEKIQQTLLLTKYIEGSYSSYKNSRELLFEKINENFTIHKVNHEIPQDYFLKSGDIDNRLDILSKILDHLKNIETIKAEFFNNTPKIYIPILRTSMNLAGSDINVYKKTIEEQYFNNETQSLSIETGLDLYEKIQYARNGIKSLRAGFEEFEKFISNNFFNGKTVDIVAEKSNSNKRNILLTIEGEREDIAIYDLGDGIQGVINLLFPIFTAKNGTWIFIDEPETHLHPGYQTIFMRAISENEFILNKELKFFITTHSNHILSEAILGKEKCEVLVFKRKDKDSSEIFNLHGNEYNVLEILGVLNTSVLISNCTVWVEGISDRLYLRAFLLAYSREEKFLPSEGLHFSFIEYAGKNLVHYNFDHKGEDSLDDENMQKIKAYFVNTNVFLLADSDFDKQKHEKYEKIKRPNFRYHQTIEPEIENLIPEIILKDWLLKEIKCDENDIAACFLNPVGNQKLGDYFDKRFKLKNGKDYRKFVAKHGGTLNSRYKNSLVNFVYNSIIEEKYSWKILSQNSTLSKIITDLYKFIIEKNKF